MAIRKLWFESITTGEIADSIAQVFKIVIEDFRTISPVTGKRIVNLIWRPVLLWK